MLKRCGLLLICCGLQLCGVDTRWIANLGGTVEQDSSGRIVAVNLRGSLDFRRRDDRTGPYCLSSSGSISRTRESPMKA